MDWLRSIDVALFHWINSGLSNPLFDALLPLLRNRLFWAPLYVFVVAFMLENFGLRKGWIMLAGLLLAVGLSDFTSSTLIKKNVQRLRPCNDIRLETTVVERIPCGSGYSFTSSHAANHFAVAVYLVAVLGVAAPWAGRVFLTWAALVAFSQIYVGVHFPFDVLGGGILGSVIGWWVYRAFRGMGWIG